MTLLSDLRAQTIVEVALLALNSPYKPVTPTAADEPAMQTLIEDYCAAAPASCLWEPIVSGAGGITVPLLRASQNVSVVSKRVTTGALDFWYMTYINESAPTIVYIGGLAINLSLSAANLRRCFAASAVPAMRAALAVGALTVRGIVSVGADVPALFARIPTVNATITFAEPSPGVFTLEAPVSTSLAAAVLLL